MVGVWEVDECELANQVHACMCTSFPRSVFLVVLPLPCLQWTTQQQVTQLTQQPPPEVTQALLGSADEAVEDDVFEVGVCVVVGGWGRLSVSPRPLCHACVFACVH